MSDSNFSKLCEWKKVHEVVDEAWAEDCLSDDEVELPAGETFGDEGAYPQRPSIKTGSADEHHIFATLERRDDDLFQSPRSPRTLSISTHTFLPLSTPPTNHNTTQARSTRATSSRRRSRSAGTTWSSRRPQAERRDGRDDEASSRVCVRARARAAGPDARWWHLGRLAARVRRRR